MMLDFANVAVFILFSIGFVLVSLTAARLLAPRAPSHAKGTPYECGEIPIGSPWIRFNARYYFYALIFLIFDVEIAFMYPCAVVFREWIERGTGIVALLEIFAFVAVLMAGFIYVWRMGYLEWIRDIDNKASDRKAA